MVNLFLNADDKVHVPQTVEINGKSHRLISLKSRIAKQLKGFCAIQNDLLQIKRSIESHIKNPSHHFEHLRSLTITYRKLWKEAGSRFAKLEEKRDLKQAPEDLLNFHSELIQLGDKYIAHPDETDYEQSFIQLILDEEKAVGIFNGTLSFHNFDFIKYRVWLELIGFLEEKLRLLILNKSNCIIGEYNKLLKS